MGWRGWESFLPGSRGAEKRSRGARMNAKPCVVDAEGNVVRKEQAEAFGIVGTFFHSTKEALRWVALQQKERRGEIRSLTRQVRFSLKAPRPDGEHGTVGVYVADFVYTDNEGRTVVEDVKGQARREDLYLWKRRHFRIEYGLEITEV